MSQPLDLWYKHALIYSLDIETYQDGNGDGIGDFAGLARRLDHLNSLGVTCLWLLPFFPSPNRDNGYDVVDYYGVDPRQGTLGDFVEFIRRAGERGIRVIMDLVINHTSDQHPWFQSARGGEGSPYYDYYVWSKKKPEHADAGVVFPGVQTSVWTYDRSAEAYYYHRFYKHQPDLNMQNPAVREEVCRIMGFWLELGVSGFRLDAAPFIVEPNPGSAGGNPQYDHLEEFRRFLSWRRGDAILAAEANVPPDVLPDYFGDGSRAHAVFNFYINQYLFLALATGRAAPLREAFARLPEVPPGSALWNFLRNHDELDLGRLTDAEREKVFAEFAPDENMRLYGRGIRRRLPSMFGGDRRRLRMAYSLMFSLPGEPVLRYGQEIGMGDDLALPERDSVRTVMQWSAGANAGFSPADPSRFPRPVIRGGEFGYENLNVAAQRRDSDSFMNWLKLLVGTWRECPEIPEGRAEVLDAGSPAVFAQRHRGPDGEVVTLHNLAAEPARARVDLGGESRSGVELLGKPGERLQEVDFADGVELEGYGYRWFRLTGGDQRGA